MGSFLGQWGRGAAVHVCPKLILTCSSSGQAGVLALGALSHAVHGYLHPVFLGPGASYSTVSISLIAYYLGCHHCYLKPLRAPLSGQFTRKLISYGCAWGHSLEGQR